MVNTCATYDSLLDKLKAQKPDLVFIELNLNSTRYDGFTICEEIKKQYSDVFVAVLSRYNAPHFIQYARQCGADAYFDKQTETASLDAFLHDLAANKVRDYYIRVAAYLNAGTRFGEDPFELRYLLTRQQCRIMKLILASKKPKEIQEDVGISYDTYKTHHANILATLHVKDDVELTKFALKHNLTGMDCESLPAYMLRKLAC
jgi:two-component system, NarL family, response regulator FusR